MNTTITRDEWMRALGEAAAPLEQDAMTVNEMCEQFGIDRSAAQRRAKQLVADGKARRTFKVYNGRRQPAYVLVKSARKPSR